MGFSLSSLSPINWVRPGTVSDGMMAGGLAGFATGNPALGMGVANMYSQQGMNEQQMALAGRQMQFQANMSNTAHQREVNDLKKAGLNPILSAGGNGSSTPSGAMAGLQAPQIDIPAVMSVAQLAQNQQRIDIERENSLVEREKKRAEIPYTQQKTRLAKKGQIRADMEGEASGLVNSMLKSLKSYWNNSQPPGSETVKRQSEFNQRMREKYKQRLNEEWRLNSSNPDN